MTIAISATSLLISGFVLGTAGLVASNALLFRSNRELRAAYHDLELQIQIPAGAKVPSLKGKTREGKDATVEFKEQNRTVIFVFSPACPVCDENWPRWSKILASARSGRVRAIGIDLSNLASPEYLKAHDLTDVVVLRNIEPLSLLAYRLRKIPETILVDKDGKVEGSWLGVLAPNVVNHLLGLDLQTRR